MNYIKRLDSVFAAKVITLLSLSIFWFFFTFNSSRDEFSHEAASVLKSYVALILLTQFIIIFSLRAASLKKISRSLFPIFSTLNIFSLYITFETNFIQLESGYQLAVLLLAVFIFHAMYQQIAHDPGTRVITPIAAILLALYGGFFPDLKNSPPLQEAPKNIHKVSFNKTPNIYFVSFDSLIPEAVANKYLGLKSIAYPDILRQYKARIFKNAFADAVPTQSSLNSLIALDIGEWKKNQQHPLKYLLGHSNGALYQILKANGYSLNFFYTDHYFGTEKGPYLDNYFTMSNYPHCRFLTKLTQEFGFFGVCHFLKGSLKKKTSSELAQDLLDFCLSKFSSQIKNGSPNFNLAYLISPKHTPKNFVYQKASDLESYKKRFDTNSKSVALQIEALINFVRQKDPGALLFIFGDHGAYMSRRLNHAENMTFIQQDRHGVMAAFYPPQVCAQSFDNPYSQEVVTISQIGLMMIRCLANGQEPLMSPKKMGAEAVKPFLGYQYE
ncbi:MAG: hypothetical protein G3M70_10365 [Candidatus Nitronauta litoralis]|uniref:Sulfatase N-terminal domain-containing protein n=1 Tax=Candidatus Nitronauta litoralis TaxID=2705533 RepID=A0A7T0BWE7_9BACT|nr:MAG: hypothetical protein G3M70_10365 [Candidatus Nitronauta litoralis]